MNEEEEEGVDGGEREREGTVIALNLLKEAKVLCYGWKNPFGSFGENWKGNNAILGEVWGGDGEDLVFPIPFIFTSCSS